MSPQREPDLGYIESAARAIAPHLKKGHVVVLESTTYPGTTREKLKPLLEAGSGLKAGVDFSLAFAPERVDPGRTDWTTKSTPKVVGGLDAASTKAAADLYRSALDNVHEVSTAEAAELTKLLENIFRSVNIALVNELAQLCDRMDIDVWEVIGAAATKPFGFMPFQPGPGLGGHCIPLDPYYLAWKAREFDFNTRFIELAGEINNNMPYFCRSVISQALNHGAQKSLKGSKILLIGVAYKADIGDVRESPAEKLLALLRNAGADVAYHDPHVPEFDGLRSMPLDPKRYDCVAIVTAHTTIDYDKLVDERVARRRPAECDRRQGHRLRQGLQVVIGVTGLGYWGPNLARNFDDLGVLSALCDLDPELRERYKARYPNARMYGDFDEVLADDGVEAIVVATPVPTHYDLARRALWAGKHVLVEKPPAMRAEEIDELVAIAAERDLVLMPGHLLLYHPGVRKLKQLIDDGELGDVLCVYGNRQNLGIVRTNENALWSLGVHDLSVMLYLLDEEPEVCVAHGRDFLTEGRRGRRLLLPALSEREDRAHAPVVARPAQDAAHHGRRPR